jgi:iron complex outermembrane receptor protein
VLWAALPWLSAYVNVGTTFQVPTTTELENPNGPGFNPAIQPQVATSWEIGTRVGLAASVEAGLSAYVIDVDDELVPFESPSGRTAFRNAGSSRRLGLELDGRASLEPWTGSIGGGALDWTGSLTVLDAHYLHYQTDAGSFSGNDEPGIPGWQVYQQLAWRHPSGAFVALEAFFVDGYFVDDANTSRTRGYPLVNLRSGLAHDFGPLTIQPFFGVQNLADASYSGVVRLNALGGRFYEPAAAINVYGGISVALHL